MRIGRIALGIAGLLAAGVCLSKLPKRGGPPPGPPSAIPANAERIGSGETPAAPEVVHLTIRADAPLGPIPDLLYGSQLVWWPESNGLPDHPLSNEDYRAAMRDWWSRLPAIREIGPTSLRYPGGLEAMEFVWTDAIGPFERRPVNRWPRHNPGKKVAVGPDEFARLAEALGAEAIVTLNVNDVPVPGAWHSGSGPEAAAWVAYMNGREEDGTVLGVDGNGRDWETAGAWARRRRENCVWMNANSGLPPRDCARPYGVRIWELGNECSYRTVWIGTSQTPARYGEIVARYSAAMKAVDPTIRVGAVGNDNPLYGYEAWKGWFAGVDNAVRQQARLKHPGGGADFWVKHEYPPGVSPVADGILLKKPGARIRWRQSVPEAGNYVLAAQVYAQDGAAWALEADGVRVAEGLAPLALDEKAAPAETSPFPLAAGAHELALVAGGNVNPRRRLEFGLRAELRKAGKKSGLAANLRASREAQALALAAAATRAAFLSEPKEALGGRPVYVTEFNHDWRFKTQRREHEPVYLQDALGVANFYARFLDSGVVGAANVWTLFDDQNEFGEIEGVAVENRGEDARAGGGAGQERGRADPRLRPTGLAHALLGRTLRGERLRVDSDAPVFAVLPGEGIEMGFGGAREAAAPWLEALAARRPDGGIAVVVANRDPRRDFEAELRVAGAEAGAEARIETLRGDGGLLASNEPEDCPRGACVRIEPSEGAARGGVLRRVFPAATLTAVVFPPPK